jgi:two-component system response regulator
VLLDIKLPRVDGLKVLGELRADPRTALVPVVMLTSSKVERDVAEAYKLGANGFVQKPVDFDEFRDVVRRVCWFWLSVNEPPPEATPSRGS